MPGRETPRPPVEVEPSIEEQLEKEREYSQLIVSWLEHDVKNGLTALTIQSRHLREGLARLGKQEGITAEVKERLQQLEEGAVYSETRPSLLQTERELYVYGLIEQQKYLLTKEECNPDRAVTHALWWLRDQRNMGEYRFLLVGKDIQKTNRVLQSPSYEKIYGNLPGSPFSVDPELAPEILNIKHAQSTDKILPKLKPGVFDPGPAARILMEKLGSLIGQSESRDLGDGIQLVSLGIESDGTSLSILARCEKPTEAIQALQYRLDRVWQKVLDNLGISKPFEATETNDWPPFNVRLRMNLLPDAAPAQSK